MARRFLTLATLALFLAPAAAADSGLGFGARPIPSGKTARGYFDWTLQPGGTVRDTLVVANTSKKRLTLRILVSNGATARNSGDAYVVSDTCRALACWIQGLPATIALAPRERRNLRFTVTAPGGTPRRQYLAGITIRPASAPRAKSLRVQHGVGTRMVIIRELTVPVAATVGELASLHSKLVVTGVRVSPSASQILVDERNVGQTFVHAKGHAICSGANRRFAYPLSSSTVMPGAGATLAANASGLVHGTTYHCSATLDFGGSVSASWRGVVTIPKNGPPKVVQTGPHRFSTLPKRGIPRWAIVVIAAGAAVVLALLVVIGVLLRRPRAAS